jgi:hypothetical protein
MGTIDLKCIRICITSLDRVGCNCSPIFDTLDAVARLRLAANQKSEISGDVERRYELTTSVILGSVVS